MDSALLFLTHALKQLLHCYYHYHEHTWLGYSGGTAGPADGTAGWSGMAASMSGITSSVSQLDVGLTEGLLPLPIVPSILILTGEGQGTVSVQHSNRLSRGSMLVLDCESIVGQLGRK